MTLSIMVRMLSASVLLALSAGQVFAQNPSYTTENDSGFYAGGGFGRFKVDVNSPADLVDTIGNFDSDDTAWKVFAGYRFNKYISIEGDYIDFGAPDDQFSSGGTSGDYTVELSGFAPYLVGTYPLGPVELYAKVGYLFYDLNISADLDDLGGNVFRSSDNGEDMVWGGGIGATFMQHLNVRAEYEVIDLEGTENSNALWLSAAWRF